MTVPAVTGCATELALTPGRRTMAMVVVALAFVMDLLDVTIVHVALPSIRAGVGAGAASLQWMVAGYALTFAVGVITGGRLGDVFGYRRVFLVGVSAFTLASLLCGLAMSPAQLVAARALQGLSAALMVPQVMALMQVMYAPDERLRVFALFGLLGGASSALGPVVGGMLIEADWWSLGWRLAFLVNAPVGLIAVVAGLCLLPAGSGACGKALDLNGTLLVALTLLALLLPLIQGPESDWPVWCGLSLSTVPLLAWGTVRAWATRQARDRSALVDPALLRQPSVRNGLLATLALSGIVPSYLLAMTFIVQTGLGASPRDMAVLCMPIAAGAAVSVGVLSRHAVRWLGDRAIAVGAVIQGLGLLWAAAAASRLLALPDAAHAVDPELLGAHGLIGLGIGFIGPPLNVLTLRHVPLSEAGSASGVIGATRQVAVALTLAGAGGLMFQGHAPPVGHAHLEQGLLRVLFALWSLLALGAFIHTFNRPAASPPAQPTPH